MKTAFKLVAYLMFPYLFCGCVTHGVDPLNPEPGLGYVDFSGHTMCVLYLKDGDKTRRIATFGTTQLGRGPIARLALPPGNHAFQVDEYCFPRRKSGVVVVPVRVGMVTQVEMEFVVTGWTTGTESKYAGSGKAWGTPAGPAFIDVPVERATGYLHANVNEPIPFQRKIILYP